MKKQKKVQFITIRVTPYAKKVLEEIADLEGRSVSGQIAYVLKQHLPHIEEPILKTHSKNDQSYSDS